MTDTITEIRLEHLVESPFNPRRIFNETALQELAADIKAQGRVLQPLLVRPLVSPLFQGDPDGQAGYELIFGHRRYRAAELAGLASVPCMVRAISDQEARRAQISENLQREDVHPIEEAEGFQALIDNDNQTADTIAEQFGKSRSYVYGRLKLLQACPAVRKQCLAGEIGSEVALLIARLRTPRLQEKALQYIAGKNTTLTDGGAQSYRIIRDLLNEKFMLDIKSAMFDPEDEMLLPLAGNCVSCPKRSSNAPEFEDVLNGDKLPNYSQRHHGANVCTDPDCFDAKKKAHLRREADKLEAKGKSVVDGNRARAAIDASGNVKGAYIALKDVQAELKKAPKRNTFAGNPVPAPEVVLIQNPRDGKIVQAVKREDLKAAGVKVKEPKKADNYEARQAREAEQRKTNVAKAQVENARRMVMLQRVRTHLAGVPRDAFDLRLVANVALGGVAWRDKPLLLDLWTAKSAEQLAKRIDTMDLADVTRLIMDCGLVRDIVAEHYNLASKPAILLAVAEHHGVDLDVPDAPAEAAPTPSSAARAPKKGKPVPGFMEGTETQVEPRGVKTAKTKKMKDDAGVAGDGAAQIDAFAAAEA